MVRERALKTMGTLVTARSLKGSIGHMVLGRPPVGPGGTSPLAPRLDPHGFQRNVEPGDAAVDHPLTGGGKQT